MLAGLASATASEDSFGLSPEACEESVTHLMNDRLFDPRSARVRLDGEPYAVTVEMRGKSNVAAWAVDVRVKSRLPSGSWSGYMPYTVIFQDGVAVALESDVQRVTRV